MQHGQKRASRLIVFLIIFAFGISLAGCSEKPVLGPINDQGTMILMRFENQGDGISGVVYRQINRFEAFLAQSKVPVLVVFYASMDPVNSQVIPLLEQMAADYQNTLQIAWIDANAQEALAASFKVERLPQFTVVVEGELKRSLVGFGPDGVPQIADLLKPYLNSNS
jgi:thiol-disulfide isomerase/thioredoxin